MTQPAYSLIIHGGAGAVGDRQDTLESIRQIVGAGEALLKQGATALDVVEHCVTLLENNPLFNAGHGSVLNHKGEVDMDAAIMDGATLQAGAVAGITRIQNPVGLARAVMEASEHVFLIGQGAEEFATHQHIPAVPAAYFITPARQRQLEQAKLRNKIVLDHSDFDAIEKKYGTVGAVARDTHGNLAAATSTGGIVNKHYGRVGDSPVIGAGTYADNRSCAVSATGVGEQLLRTVMAKHIADIVTFEHTDAPTAAQRGIDYLVERVNGLGGVIVIDSRGNIGRAYSTPGMIHGFVKAGDAIQAGLEM